ncbi:hypothetical protein [Maridesulfovibrio frigidus]|uniref:hypothetical protein n=1 Tax=Maridesulfovibrio frigidus TaxID=340956 RepID=UPI0004E24321|nr:hypothetical protein [Maridesulfovibrio frigidus]
MSKDDYKENIIKLSEATTWDIAKLEWSLRKIYETEEPENCLCCHSPIQEFSVIKNTQNNNEAIIGSCCVNEFPTIPSDKIFQAIKRIRDDDQKALNEEAIQYAYNKKWINYFEYGVLLKSKSRRKLSYSQLQTRMGINRKVLQGMKTRKA